MTPLSCRSGSTEAICDVNSSAIPSCPLPALRAAIRDRHARIEAHPRLLPLITGSGLDRGAYVRILHAFLVYYRALEARFLPAWSARVEPTRGDYCYRPRAPLLAADLADLGVADRGTTLRPSLPALDDMAALLGTAYVIEGSTRGGRIVAPRLARVLGLDARHGARFFTLDSEHETGSWPALVTLLRNAPADTQAMTAAACTVFDGLHECLDRCVAADEFSMKDRPSARN